MNALESSFRVIVVGAGVVGLAAAHCLKKAGIDHVVLERRSEIAPAEGASTVIYPRGARTLHQIGCLEAAKVAYVLCDRWWCRRPDGKAIMNNGLLVMPKKKDFLSHGQDILLLERREFLKILYDGLKDQSRIRNSCELREVKQFFSSVEVTMADGTVEKGDIVVGCDGVNSLIWEIMWESGKKATPKFIIAKKRLISMPTA